MLTTQQSGGEFVDHAVTTARRRPALTFCGQSSQGVHEIVFFTPTSITTRLKLPLIDWQFSAPIDAHFAVVSPFSTTFVWRSKVKEITFYYAAATPAGNITFKWGDAIQEGSSALDGAKFNKNATYNLKVDNVPAAGTYVLTLPLMGSEGNETRTFNTTGTNHDGQGFSIAVGETAGTILVADKTYAEVFGASQTAWVDVAFAEVALAAGSNIITLKTTGAGYRISINVESNITLAAK